MITALLDTNVIIGMEDTGRPMSELVARILQKSRGCVDYFIHELQLEDINNDSNEERRTLLLSRIKQFKQITDPPVPSDEAFAARGWKNSNRNDFIDNALLLCVDKHAVGFLVTNDKEILAKAAKSGIRDRVLRLDEFEQVLPADEQPIDLAAVTDTHCYNLDITEPFFDSLREDYNDFDAWYETQCCETHRRCWVIRTNTGIGALCIYKDEKGEPINDAGFTPHGKTLKLCTLKVGESARGRKFGERLLYCAFRYAREYDYSAVYFTTREDKQSNLIELGHEFGFDKCGQHDKDAVFLKYMMPQSESDYELGVAEFNRRFYPCFKNEEGVRKYLVPILPVWHEKLFPDISDISHSLLRDLPEFYGAEGNTIKKAYLSRSGITPPKAGDLLLFYRIDDRHAIDTMGIVVDAMRSTDVDEIVALTKRRTVYNPSDIREMVNSSANGVLIISFNLVNYFERHPASLAEMQRLGISAPQSIASISDNRFGRLMEVLS